MKKVILSDLNLVLFGVMMGFAGANGSFQNPMAAPLSTLIICGLIYFKYLNKETSTVTEKEESMKNYQMPSAKELAEKLLSKNPQLNENYGGLGPFMVSPFAEPMYNEQAQRIQNKIKISSPSYKRNLRNQKLNLQATQKSEASHPDGDNVVDFEVFKIKKMMRQRKTEDAG